MKTYYFLSNGTVIDETITTEKESKEEILANWLDDNGFEYNLINEEVDGDFLAMAYKGNSGEEIVISERKTRAYTLITRTEFINSYITNNKSEVDIDKVTDTYHTFGELYYHRMILFAVICNQNKTKSWKSLKHDDGTMFDDYFIVGVETDEGNYTYHYHIKHWENFNVEEITRAPEWDGHKPEDITRLLSLT